MPRKKAKPGRGGAREGAGRNLLYGEPTRQIAGQVPVSLIAKLDRRAKSEGLTRSAAVTAALREWVAS